MPRLIVNADDFGLTSGVNRAIVELHHAGLVTSATIMARAPATEEAIDIARSTPSLGMGCHIVFTGGEPILSAFHDLPDISDPANDRFATSLPAFLDTIYRTSPHNRVDHQIEIEARAQIEFLQNAGLRLTHIDTHKHTHAFPRVLRPLLRAARSCGITRIRNPFEPLWAVRATTSAGLLRAGMVAGLLFLRSIWQRILREEGFTTTDGTLAMAGTGVLDSAMIRSLVGQAPEGTWELITHPGYNDDDLARIETRLRASREIERLSLIALKEIPNLELIGFGSLELKPSNDPHTPRTAKLPAPSQRRKLS